VSLYAARALVDGHPSRFRRHASHLVLSCVSSYAAGMCKRHYKESIAPAVVCQPVDDGAAAAAEEEESSPGNPPPGGEPPERRREPSRSRPGPVASVYEHVLPSSISWHPNRLASSSNGARRRRKAAAAAPSDAPQQAQNGEGEGPGDAAEAPSNRGCGSLRGGGVGGAATMPLVSHLRRGRSRPFGWHRSEERAARGAGPVPNVKVQLEPWERQLVRCLSSAPWKGIPSYPFEQTAPGQFYLTD
jgi:hypothetical protein